MTIKRRHRRKIRENMGMGKKATHESEGDLV